MWSVDGERIQMVEGDWGVALPLTITGITIAQNDEIIFTVRKLRKTPPLVEKTATGTGTINVVLTEEESAGLKIGKYRYTIDWKQGGAFEANLLRQGVFEVVAK